MKIYYLDGGVLDCVSVTFCGDTLIADDIYNVPISEIDRIEED